MTTEPVKCPECGLYSPPGAIACDCGFDFSRDTPRSAFAWSGPGFGSAFVVSVVASVATSQFLVLLGNGAQRTLGMPIIAVLFGTVAAVLSRRSSRANWGGALGIFAGIAVGVFIDAAIGAALARPDRNLWPLEILFAWVIVAIPVGLGVNVGRYSDRAQSSSRRR